MTGSIAILIAASEFVKNWNVGYRPDFEDKENAKRKTEN